MTLDENAVRALLRMDELIPVAVEDIAAADPVYRKAAQADEAQPSG
ncbi:MAG: hypothetical protein HYY28_08645 [Betaproteobacteria bacterium]|nr:hypothetical protein [Betaproteobacteria bacterium]MBI2960367.1 hypothetical protein [Betaproteobacteria bacterium]